MGKLDSAMLNRSRHRRLLALFVDVELQGESIVDETMIEWCMRLKPLRVELFNVSADILIRLVEFCPQLVSISTWDVDEDVQDAIVKRVKEDEYEVGWFDEHSVSTILQICSQLKSLRLCHMSENESWQTCFSIAHLCTTLDELWYQQAPDGPEDECVHSAFYLRRTSFRLDCIAFHRSC